MKILAQVEHLVKQGVDAMAFSICAGKNEHNDSDLIRPLLIPGTERPKSILGKIYREWHVNNAIKNMIPLFGGNDIIYMRIRYPSLQLSWILKQPRKCKIVIEYQTIEPSEYRKKKKYWYLLPDLLFGNAIRKYTDAIVGVTTEVTQYQLKRAGTSPKPHITIGNGFDVSSVPVRHPPPFNGDSLHILCVAIVHRGHGLDRLIKGIASYKGCTNITFHIAGRGAEIDNLLNLAKILGVSKNFVPHGFTKGKDLDMLFNQCHIGVGTLGLHRNGLTEGSILKAREYCARGLPFLYDAIDLDFPSDFPYILRLPADESPIEIEDVLAFAKDVCADPDHPEKMRRYARENLDWSVKMKRLKKFLERLVGEEGDDIAPETGKVPLTARGPRDPGGTALSGAGGVEMNSGSSRERGS